MSSPRSLRRLLAPILVLASAGFLVAAIDFLRQPVSCDESDSATELMAQVGTSLPFAARNLRIEGSCDDETPRWVVVARAADGEPERVSAALRDEWQCRVLPDSPLWPDFDDTAHTRLRCAVPGGPVVYVAVEPHGFLKSPTSGTLVQLSDEVAR